MPEHHDHEPGQPVSTGAHATRLLASARAMAAAETDREKTGHLAELWPDLQVVLFCYARAHARRLAGLDTTELRDIAAEKALDLVRRLDSPQGGDLLALAEAPFCAFLSSVARNGVVDRFRVLTREQGRDDERAGDDLVEGSSVTRPRPVGHERHVERLEFAMALKECASRLTPRARRVWSLRVFHELPSKDIACHPDVKMNVGAIDMTLARARSTIRECMEAKGLAYTGGLPAGTFATLWDLFGQECAHDVGEEDAP